MMTNASRCARLRELGQSVWLDLITRDLIASGELRRLMDVDGVAAFARSYGEAVQGMESKGRGEVEAA